MTFKSNATTSQYEFNLPASMLFWNLLFYLTVTLALPTHVRWKYSQLVKGINGNLSNPERVFETEYVTKILQNRNTSVDPCDDFYEYACGLWKKNNPRPDTELAWSQGNIQKEEIDSRIRDLLEEEDKPTDLKPIKMVKQFYRSCMNRENIEKIGIQPLQKILDENGGWPMAMPLSEWNDSSTSWQEIDKRYIMLIDNSAFYNIGQDIDSSMQPNILIINQNIEHPLKGEKAVKEKLKSFIHPYLNSIAEIARAFAKEKGHVLNETQLIDDVRSVVRFGLSLKEIVDSDKNDNETNKEKESRMTIKELEEWYNSLNVTTATANIRFLETIQYAFEKVHVRIDASEPIIVHNKEFLQKLAELLARTPQRDIVNYVQWNMIDRFLKYTNEKMRNIQMNYVKYNITQERQRWEFCTSNLEMKDAVSYLFVKKYFSDDTINSVMEMIDIMQVEFEQRITRAKWIGNDMKDFMKEKLKNLVRLIGYPEWYKNDTALVHRYDGLTIGDNYFENVVKCKMFDIMDGFKRFKDVIPRTEWLDYPITLNAFYFLTNAILIPAAVLQGPYFTKYLPDAVNYGSIGFLLGHELSHSFDNVGIRRDKTGNKVSWDLDVFNTYKTRATCFADQFHNYTLGVTADGDLIQVDGKLTEDENIADSVGLDVAFAAYTKAKEKRKNQHKLPGLEEISDDELFFLSFANDWCSSPTPQYDADIANEDEHSPAKFRVIGSLSNTNFFATTYKCSPGSPMNPQKKCTFWE